MDVLVLLLLAYLFGGGTTTTATKTPAPVPPPFPPPAPVPTPAPNAPPVAPAPAPKVPAPGAPGVPGVAGQLMLQQGHIPFHIAKWYTGDGNRWRELPKVNAGMPLASPALDKWWSKQIQTSTPLLLPVGWDVAKGPAPTLGAPAKKAGPTVPTGTGPVATNSPGVFIDPATGQYVDANGNPIAVKAGPGGSMPA